MVPKRSSGGLGGSRVALLVTVLLLTLGLVAVLAFEVPDQRVVGRRRPGYLFDQVARRQAAALAVDLFVEPAAQGCELAVRELPGDVAEVAAAKNCWNLMVRCPRMRTQRRRLNNSEYLPTIQIAIEANSPG